MAQKLYQTPKKIIAAKKSATPKPRQIVLVGTYKEKQLAWIKNNGVYNYPVKDGDEFDAEAFAKIRELWLYAGAKSSRSCFAAEFVQKMTQAEFVAAYPTYAKLGKSRSKAYYVFKTAFLTYGPKLEDPLVLARSADFGGRSVKVKKAIEAFKAGGEFGSLADFLPSELSQVPRARLRVCEAAVQLDFLGVMNVVLEPKAKRVSQKCATTPVASKSLCTSISGYSKITAKAFSQRKLFAVAAKETSADDIRVIELFAGVGGFRIGLERASNRYKTVWNNQWEPSTKRQDASNVYQKRFGSEGHCNEDIATVPVTDIPNAELLVGGFPCQDYSVATTLKNSGGIEGKKGVLWWQIHRILRDKGDAAPRFLMLENVDRLLKSPATQRGRDFAIILASLSDLGYCVEWRVINAADYGMPQRRRRTYIVAYRNGTTLAKDAALALTAPIEWLTRKSVEAQAFESKVADGELTEFDIEGTLADVTQNFNAAASKDSPFCDAGFMVNRHVCTVEVEPVYDGHHITLGELVERDDSKVPAEFFVSERDLSEWQYLKGPKSEERTSTDRDGNRFTYHYSEGGMAFPDSLDKPSRTIITGEGGAGPSRFKHVIKTPSGKYRRLMPIELERLNMFPDNHTEGASDIRRAFLMGNALVTGIVERIGIVLKERMR